MKNVSQRIIKSLAGAMLLSATLSAYATDDTRFRQSLMTPSLDTIQLYNWHGQPKRTIGQDPRTYREAARLRIEQQRFAADIESKENDS